MRFPKTHTLQEVAEWLDCSFAGPADHEITGLNEIHVVEPGDIVFVDHPKYYDKALQSAATTVLINKEVEVPEGKGLLITDDPFRDFVALINKFRPFVPMMAQVATSATIGEGTVIQPGVVIGNHVTIGKNCIIHPNVTIYDHTEIGDNVVIHGNVTIGGDGFYYKKRPEGFDQLKSGGNVVIEDDVHIGANCTIDRGVTASTRIGKGSKLDNQIQIGHDTVLGEKCLIASQTGIAGCVRVGKEVTIWGQVGVGSDVSIGDKAVVLGQSGVSKDLEGGKTYFGYPADEVRTRHRELAALRLLPEFLKKFK